MNTEHSIFLIMMYLGFLIFLGPIMVGLYVFYRTELKDDTFLNVRSIKEYVKKYQYISNIGLITIAVSIILSLIFG